MASLAARAVTAPPMIHRQRPASPARHARRSSAAPKRRNRRFDSVGALFRRGKYDCSATLIHPRLVVSAAHCTKLTGEVGDAQFLVGSDSRNPRERHVVLDFPEKPASRVDLDVTLLYLQTPSAAPLARIAPARLATSDVGRRFTAMAFGGTQHDASGAEGLVGVRRSGPITLRAVGGMVGPALAPTAEGFASLIDKTLCGSLTLDGRKTAERYYERMMTDDQIFCGLSAGDVQPRKGDSGSPLLTVDADSLLVHAVTSEGQDFDGYALGSVYTQFPDDLRGWIDTVVTCVDKATPDACRGVTWRYARGPGGAMIRAAPSRRPAWSARVALLALRDASASSDRLQVRNLVRQPRSPERYGASARSSLGGAHVPSESPAVVRSSRVSACSIAVVRRPE
jgi:hypothetical protein